MVDRRSLCHRCAKPSDHYSPLDSIPVCIISQQPAAAGIRSAHLSTAAEPNSRLSEEPSCESAEAAVPGDTPHDHQAGVTLGSFATSGLCSW